MYVCSSDLDHWNIISLPIVLFTFCVYMGDVARVSEARINLMNRINRTCRLSIHRSNPITNFIGSDVTASRFYRRRRWRSRICKNLTYCGRYDNLTSGVSKGARGTRPLQIFQFHAVLRKIWQNRMLAPPPPRGLAPLPRGNSGSATAHREFMTTEGVTSDWTSWGGHKRHE